MVDLVKIRRKAKEKGAAPPPVAASPPVAEEAQVHPGNGQRATGNEQPATGSAPSKLDRFLQTAGTRRGGAVAQVDMAAEEQLELLTFDLAGEQYAVPIETIVEVVTPRSVTPIPNADSAVVGIMSLRGTIVTLIDVRRRLRHPKGAAVDADPRIVVAEHRGEHVGFEVDRVLRVVKVEAAEVDPHPVVHSTELDESIRGVFRHGDALTILLDLDKLLGGAVAVSIP